MKRDQIVAMLPFYLLAVIFFVGLAKAGSESVTAISQNLPPDREHTIVIDAGHGGIDGGATSCTGVLESEINLQIAMKLNDLVRFLGYETVMIRTSDTSIYTDGNTIAAQKLSDLKERVRIVNGAGSKELANALQTSFIQTVNPGSKRNSKKANGIYLMENIKTPGVLIECGFISNPEEEAKLRSRDYQQKLCCIITTSLSEYLSNT